MSQQPPLVAIFDGYDDTAEMLTAALDQQGLRTVHGRAEGFTPPRLSAFLESCAPQAIIWDVAPPYDANWNLLEMVRSHPALANIGIVVTTTCKTDLSDSSAADRGVLPIVAKPYDLDALVAAVLTVLPTFTPAAPLPSAR